MFLAVIIGISAVILFLLLSKMKKSRQLAYIENYQFHPSLKDRVSKTYPELSDEQLALVFTALRDYFQLCFMARKRMVAMPSQAVDVAWHEFILFTRHYQEFCTRALGRFLHHTPTEAMKTPTLAQEGIKRTWRLACAKEKIDPANPAKLPLLFAIDERLKIRDGFKYSRNCQSSKANPLNDSYCAAHIGCSTGCVGDSAAASESSSFFGGGDSGGGWGSDSGSSCGGSCGGD